MNFGITTVCIAPLRANASHHSAMVSQLLFGETFDILFEEKGWLKVACHHDHFEAWVDHKQILQIVQKDLDKIQSRTMAYSFDAFNTGISKEEHLPIVLGSNLPQFDGLSFRLQKEKIIFNGQVLTPNESENNFHLVEKICLKYLNAPYQAGGRSPFGIDAAGFTQMVHKLLGKELPRTIEEQQQQGRALAFLSEAQDGDLVFCKTEDGEKHVGVYLGGNRIVHAYGKVKIDKLDAHGIFDERTKKYSHQLEVVIRG